MEIGQSSSEAQIRDTDCPLLPIQTEGTGRPFFCTHGVVPTLWYLRELSRHLGTNQPFYGLQAQGVSGQTAPHRTVEEMAARYRDAIRAVQPEGPYCLGGFSFGGLVAFELAQQLRRDGAEIELVALIDTCFPIHADHVPPRSWLGERAYPFLISLDWHLQEWGARGPAGYLYDRALYVRDGVRRRVARAVKRVSGRSVPEGWDLAEPVRHVVEASMHAMRTYQPTMYDGSLVQFCGADTSLRELVKRLAWDQVASGGLEVHVVPGDHLSLRDESHMPVLADKLRTRLDGGAASPRPRVRVERPALAPSRFAVLSFASIASLV